MKGSPFNSDKMSYSGSSSFGHTGGREVVVEQSEGVDTQKSNKITSTQEQNSPKNDEQRGQVNLILSSQGDSLGPEFAQVQQNLKESGCSGNTPISFNVPMESQDNGSILPSRIIATYPNEPHPHSKVVVHSYASLKAKT